MATSLNLVSPSERKFRAGSASEVMRAEARATCVGLACVLLCGGLMAAAEDESAVRVVREVPATAPGGHYVSNRDPLAPSALVKLPIGAIEPRGWLRHMLEIEAAGMIGHLPEISKWCKFDGNAWTNPEGKGHSGWEEMPYWLKGYGDLGYVLRSQPIIERTRDWIEAVLATQADDGWFGPSELRRSLDGKPDLWPNMIMLNILQSYYEATGDPRILPFMTKYFRWELDCLEDDFLAGFWPKMRAGDNLESIYWLYNRTGEKWLLDVARKVHRHTADWTSGIPTTHGVNICQGFREPAVYFLQARDRTFLDATERNYLTVMAEYGQVPGGMFGADENFRKGFGDPRQGAETCSMVEFMHSFEMLTKITANPLWADRCEEVAFNSLPAALTPDFKALHYLTSPNMIQLDRHDKSPGVENGGTMLSYSPFEVYRCCQHNVSHGWPYYAEELWLATGDRGLCASLYAASEVSAKVGDGSTVKIVEETDYPFSDMIQFRLSAPKPVRFPLYLRIPRWCHKPQLKVNGREAKVQAEPLSYLVVERSWADGDSVSLQLPMSVDVRVWKKNYDSVSVDYGPLTFSLKIGEKWQRYGGTDQWPEQEVLPTTAWNYGLVLDQNDPARSFEVVRKRAAPPAQPFETATTPIELQVKARKISAWQKDKLGLVGKLQASPARSEQPLETITLVPMGCARLRIAAFPTIGSGHDAHEWVSTE